MTAVEMQYDFEMKMGVFHSLDKPFTSIDIAYFLNQAQDYYVDQRYSDKFRADTYFEADEKVRTELGSIIKAFEATGSNLTVSSNTMYSSSKMISLPSDYLYSIWELCRVIYTDCNGASATYDAKVLPLRHDEGNENIHNPYRKPYKKLVWRFDYGLTGSKRHEIVTDSSHTLYSYKMRYIKKPRRIDIINGVDCELHFSTHDQIVNMAVEMALRTIVSDDNKNNVEQKQES